MSFKYKWKNGSMPSRDQAARSQYLLDQEQFHNEQDRNLAEEHARKHLGVPTRIPDDERSILPQAAPNGSEDQINQL
ncbi:bromodomain-containing protein [Brasilonema sp. CT11]|nr:bromodomain-containing protein [Brasilonema sp. CT11]